MQEFAFKLSELISVVDIAFVARAVNQPEFMPTISGVIREEVVEHAAKRSDPRSRADEDGVLNWIVQREQTVRTMPTYLLPFVEVAEEVGHEALADTVQAQLEFAIAAWRRSDRVSARLFAPVSSALFDGDELARLKVETFDTVHMELEMARLL